MALSKSRNTMERAGEILAFAVAANTTCYQGGLAVLDGGYAAPGSTGLGLIAVGRFEQDATAVAAGDAMVTVKPGVFNFNNSLAADLIAQANVGSDCYIVDDETVALTDGAGTRSRAGKIMAVDNAGVWVRIGLNY